MNYLDYIIIFIIVFYGLWGLAKGLKKLFFDLIGYAIAFISAIYLSPYLREFISSTAFYIKIQNGIYDTFSRISPTITHSIDTLKIPTNINELFLTEPGLRDVFSTFPGLKETLNNNIIALSGKPFLHTMTLYLIGILSILLIFIVVKVVFSIIVSITIMQYDSYPLAITNRILGLTIGIFIAICLVALSLQLLEAYSITISPVIAETIKDSKYGHIFTSFPILEWVQNIVPK